MAIPFKYLPAIALLLATLTFTANVASADEKPLKETDVEQMAIKLANETVQGGYQLLTVQEIKAMTDAKETFVLIDAHPRNEFVGSPTWTGPPTSASSPIAPESGSRT